MNWELPQVHGTGQYFRTPSHCTQPPDSVPEVQTPLAELQERVVAFEHCWVTWQASAASELSRTESSAPGASPVPHAVSTRTARRAPPRIRLLICICIPETIEAMPPRPLSWEPVIRLPAVRGLLAGVGAGDARAEAVRAVGAERDAVTEDVGAVAAPRRAPRGHGGGQQGARLGHRGAAGNPFTGPGRRVARRAARTRRRTVGAHAVALHPAPIVSTRSTAGRRRGARHRRTARTRLLDGAERGLGRPQRALLLAAHVTGVARRQAQHHAQQST